MFVWFWFPNKLFQALHAFNWMTWIAPENKNLAIVAGFYGVLGFNPWAAFDWNVSGTGALVTSFFSFMLHFSVRETTRFTPMGPALRSSTLNPQEIMISTKTFPTGHRFVLILALPTKGLLFVLVISQPDSSGE